MDSPTEGIYLVNLLKFTKQGTKLDNLFAESKLHGAQIHWHRPFQNLNLVSLFSIKGFVFYEWVNVQVQCRRGEDSNPLHVSIDIKLVPKSFRKVPSYATGRVR